MPLHRREVLKGAGAFLTGAAGLSSVAPAVASAAPTAEADRSQLFPACWPMGRPEPNIELAKLWWPEPRNVWTPVGWKDHLFRFDVVYNGSLLCSPTGWMVKTDVAKYRGHGFQLNFTPSVDGSIPEIPHEYTKLYKTDGGLGMQGWRENQETPVLWTRWPCRAGVVMQKEVFAHIKGGQEVKTGIEPLYAWIRLSTSYVYPVADAPKTYRFGIQLSRVYYDVGGDLDDSVFLAINPKKPGLQHQLTASPLAASGGGKAGLKVMQEDLVRIMVLPGGDGEVSLKEIATHPGTYELTVTLPSRVGAHTDLLVPMLPEPQDVIQAEANLNFDGALEQCEAFWKARPATAAHIHTPEKYINEALKRNIQFSQVIAERNPETDDYSFLSGSYGYDALWSTPTSMVSHMFLDLLGYHDVVEQHVELYKKYQGTVKPPGPAYTLDPGYFSTPKDLTAINWLSDHGAILEIMSQHALITGRKYFIAAWLDPILKACDFIKKASVTGAGGGVPGILPPAVATDSQVPVQAIWSEAWNYKGLVSAVKVLKTIAHPRAKEFEEFAESFRTNFEKGFRARTAEEPEWEDLDGQKHHVLATFLVPSPEKHAYDSAFLLDTGPLVLPWAGLFDANDPEMIAFENFFRVGPNTRLRGPRDRNIYWAVLKHEISSCETCYSWNIVNSWKRGDRDRFLEGMYSLFAGGISPRTYINCEHRNAMYGTLFVAPLMTWCLRQAMVDDQLTDGELHLLRLCPAAWLSTKEETLFENMPTLFGSVHLRAGLSADASTLNVTFRGDWRRKPAKVILHVPPLAGIERVVVNGKHRAKSNEIEIETV